MKKQIVCALIVAICSVQLSADQDQNLEVIHSFIASLKLPYLSQSQTEQIAQNIVRYAKESSIDPLLVTALMYRESTFNPSAVSVTGAQGLGQIKSMNFPDLEITDAFDIAQNTKGTARYLKKMLSLWNDHPQQIEYALASYFKGHNGFKRDGCAMDQKTAKYVDNIIAKYYEVIRIKEGKKDEGVNSFSVAS